ncbi:MAG: hypothetical protein ACREBQ_08270, partial [Nitrososphaerales archaeon]
FGCPTLTGLTCASGSQTPQTITLTVGAGDAVDLAQFTQIANTINNISSTYSMKLSVVITIEPLGVLYSQLFAGELEFSFAGWIADYPWVVDFSAPMLAPAGAYTGGTNMNYPYLANLESQAALATSTGNTTGLVKVARLMDTFASQQVMYIYTFYTLIFTTFTVQINPLSAYPNSAAGYGLYQNLW